jgi:transposase-like protein
VTKNDFAHLTKVKKKAVARSLGKGATMTAAAAAAGVCRRTVYVWLNEDPEMAEFVKQARENAVREVWGEVFRMATTEDYEETETIVEENGDKIRKRARRTQKRRHPAGWAVEIFLRNNDPNYIAQADGATVDVAELAKELDALGSGHDTPPPDQLQETPE